jgi:hypothetical protein
MRGDWFSVYLKNHLNLSIAFPTRVQLDMADDRGEPPSDDSIATFLRPPMTNYELGTKSSRLSKS